MKYCITPILESVVPAKKKMETTDLKVRFYKAFFERLKLPCTGICIPNGFTRILTGYDESEEGSVM